MQDVFQKIEAEILDYDIIVDRRGSRYLDLLL